MKRLLIITGLLCVMVLAVVLAGCGSSGETSTPGGGSGDVVTTGKPQALVFTTPT